MPQSDRPTALLQLLHRVEAVTMHRPIALWFVEHPAAYNDLLMQLATPWVRAMPGLYAQFTQWQGLRWLPLHKSEDQQLAQLAATLLKAAP